MPFREGLRHSKAGLGACQSEGVDFRGEPCASARSISSAPMIRGRVLLGVVGMGSRLHGNDGGGVAWGGGDGFPSSRERRRRRCLGWWGWVPAFAGTTEAVLLGVVGMGSRLHGNDGWGWVPVFTGTTEAALLGVVGMGSRLHGNDGGSGGNDGVEGWVPVFTGTTGGVAGMTEGDGFPSSRERRRGGWVPAFAGMTGGVAGMTEGDGFPPSRERRGGGRE